MKDSSKKFPGAQSALSKALVAVVLAVPFVLGQTAAGRESGHSMSPPTLAQFAQVSGMQPPPGTQLEPTVVEGLYAFRFPNNTTDRCAQYISADLRLIANQGRKGWSYVRGGGELSEADQAAIGQRIARAIEGKTIPVGSRGNEFALTLISAVDCPYCRTLESELQKRGIAYRVVPGVLSPDNEGAVEAVWRATDPGRAWFAALSGRNEKVSLTSDRGEYPRRAFRDVRCMTGGTTPTAIFPDGRIMVGVEAILSRL